MQAKPADEGQAAERAGAHGEIDDDHVRLLGAIEAKAVGEALRLDDLLDAGILEQLATALQHDRMIVDDEDAAHDISPTSSGTFGFSALARCTGISM